MLRAIVSTYEQVKHRSMFKTSFRWCTSTRYGFSSYNSCYLTKQQNIQIDDEKFNSYYASGIDDSAKSLVLPLICSQIRKPII